MYLILVICILASSAAALPVHNATQLTPQLLKQSLEPMLAFEKYFDEAYLNALRTIFNSDRLLQQASDFLNKVNEKKITRPANHKEAVGLVEVEYPELGSVLRAMSDDYDNKYKSLSEEAKKFLDSIENRFYLMSEEMAKAGDQLQASGQISDSLALVRTECKLFLENYREYEALPEKTLNELKKNWPKMNDFFHSNVFGSLIRMVENAEKMNDAELKEYISKFKAFL